METWVVVVVAVIALAFGGVLGISVAALFYTFHDRRSGKAGVVASLPPDRPPGTLLIPTDGSAALFTKPPHKHPVYEITITGFITYRSHDGSEKQMDAFYEADSTGRFVNDHDRFLVNGKPCSSSRASWSFFSKSQVSTKGFQADRANHFYRFEVDGDDERLALSCAPPSAPAVATTLAVAIRTLPAGTPTVAARYAAEEAQVEADNDARQRANEAALAAAEAARLAGSEPWQ